MRISCYNLFTSGILPASATEVKVKMAQNVKVCDISEDVQERLKKFRFRKEKTVAALLLKINMEERNVVLEEEFEDVTIEEIQSEITESQPRYVILSYVRDHGDGRISYPLCFLYICPSGCKPEMSMMYAGTRNALQQQLGLTKVFELRTVEDFTDEWLNEKLAFFK